MTLSHARPERADLLELYDSVGWSAYTEHPEALERAVANSTHVVCGLEDDRLVALARCVSDDVSICYIQDILVRPSEHRKGWGRRLVQDCLTRFEHVRQKILITDDRPEQLAFYKSLGFTDTSGTPLHAFVQMPGL